MSTFLIDEHPLVVQPTLAQALGINQSIILQQIQYWASKEKNVRDGHAWVYNTYEAWHKQFPWMSVPTIKRYVLELEGKGVLISESHGFDRTKWYRVDREKLAAIVAELNDGTSDDGPSEPDPVDGQDLIPSKESEVDALHTETNQRLPREGERPRTSPYKASPEARALAHAWYKALNLTKPPASPPKFYADMQRLADAGMTPDELSGEIAWLQGWAKNGISLRLVLSKLDEYRTIAPQDSDRFFTIGGITYQWGEQ